MRQYNTRGKEIILEYIRSRQGARFCVSDIVVYLKEEQIEINQATIYRNLEKLTEQGCLLKTKNAADDSCYYQFAAPEHHCCEHLHLQCKKCGSVLHLEGAQMDKFYDYIREELGFDLNHKESVLVGLCQRCRQKRETAGDSFENTGK